MIALLAAAHAASQGIPVPSIRWLAILPPIIMIGGAVVLLGVASLVSRPLRVPVSTIATVVISGGALGVALWQWSDVQDHGPHTYIKQAVVMDGFSVLVTMLVAIAMLLSALVADGYLRREGVHGAEFHVLAMVSASGAMLMAMANDLIIVFLGLEILSIALYVLTAFNYRRAASGEAALKYFILGGFSSAIFVYGIALTYGATGSTNLTQISDFLSKNVVLSNGLLLAGLSLMLVGFAFKIAAVPFHMWTPDVYQGAPSPVTGFMSAVAKAGAFAALLRVLFSSFGVVSTDWRPIVYGLAVLSLLLGAFVALRQRDVKRMLAYSSINHAGFILLGVVAGTARGAERVALLPLRVHVHGHRQFRRRHRARRGGRRRPRPGSLPRPGRPPARVGAGLRGAAARPGGCALHDRPVGQGAGGLRGRRGGRRAPRRDRHGERRRGGLLLPAGGGADVRRGRAGRGRRGHGRLGRARGGRRHGGWRHHRGGDRDRGHVCGWLGRATELEWATPGSAAGAVTTLNEQILLTEEEGGAPEAAPVPVLGGVAIALCTAVTVLFGVWPQPLIDFANHATLLFLPK